MSTARLQSRLLVERLPSGRRVLLKPLEIDLGQNFGLWSPPGVFSREVEGGKRTTWVIVPDGFETDYSSIDGWPVGLFVSVISVVTLGIVRLEKHRSDVAGVVHDWLYAIGAPRGVADRIWRHVARSGGEDDAHQGPVSAFVGWAGLRLGGWVAYRQHARRRGE